jgi:hypothetical protein
MTIQAAITIIGHSLPPISKFRAGKIDPIQPGFEIIIKRIQIV